MGGMRILVVDDEGFLGSALALSGPGNRIVSAPDVPRALHLVRSGGIDVVVADHVLPGLAELVHVASGHGARFRFIERPGDPVAIRREIASALPSRSWALAGITA